MGFIDKLKSVNNSWGYVTYLSDGSLGRLFGRIGPKNLIDNREQELMISSGMFNGNLKDEIVFAAKDVEYAQVLQATGEWVKYRMKLKDGLVAIVIIYTWEIDVRTKERRPADGWLNFEAWIGEALEAGVAEELRSHVRTHQEPQRAKSTNEVHIEIADEDPIIADLVKTTPTPPQKKEISPTPDKVDKPTPEPTKVAHDPGSIEHALSQIMWADSSNDDSELIDSDNITKDHTLDRLLMEEGLVDADEPDENDDDGEGISIICSQCGENLYFMDYEDGDEFECPFCGSKGTINLE